MDTNLRARITMLGNTASGKTCFMAGMYAAMSMGVKGFTFLASDMDQDLKLIAHWEQMMNADKGKDRWPGSTTASTSYAFEFCYGLDSLIGFDWLDYRGGALQEEKNTAEVQTLIKSLQDSACVFLCISGEHLEDDIKGREQIISRNLLVNRMQGFLRNIPSGRAKPAIVFVITKFDRIDRYGIDPVKRKIAAAEDIKTLFSPFFMPNTGWLTMICPVTLGKDLAKQPNNGSLNPQNMHFPISFAVYYTLKNEADKIRKSQSTKQHTLSTMEQEGPFQRIFSNQKRKLTAQEITELKNYADDLDRRMNLIGKELMQRVSVYFNGEEVDLDV